MAVNVKLYHKCTALLVFLVKLSVETARCLPTAICKGVNIPKIPGCHVSWQISSQRGSQKITSMSVIDIMLLAMLLFISSSIRLQKTLAKFQWLLKGCQLFTNNDSSVLGSKGTDSTCVYKCWLDIESVTDWLLMSLKLEESVRDYSLYRKTPECAETGIILF